MSALRRIRLVTRDPDFLALVTQGWGWDPVSANTAGAGASDQDLAGLAPAILQSHLDIRKVNAQNTELNNFLPSQSTL